MFGCDVSKVNSLICAYHSRSMTWKTEAWVASLPQSEFSFFPWDLKEGSNGNEESWLGFLPSLGPCSVCKSYYCILGLPWLNWEGWAVGSILFFFFFFRATFCDSIRQSGSSEIFCKETNTGGRRRSFGAVKTEHRALPVLLLHWVTSLWLSDPQGPNL